MSIDSYEQFLALAEVGRICALALRAMSRAVRPGITTQGICDVGVQIMRANGARSAPRLVYAFPGEMCISVNDEAVHGIPGDRVIHPGDFVKLDVTFEKNGYMADAAITVPVEPVREQARRLLACAESAFQQALRLARPPNRVNQIGEAVECAVRRCGFSVIRQLGGHGIGRTIHEPPSVPNFNDPAARQVLTAGMVLAVEPVISAGTGASVTAEDGWTERTADGSLSAHFEHTIVVTPGAPILLTAASCEIFAQFPTVKVDPARARA